MSRKYKIGDKVRIAVEKRDADDYWIADFIDKIGKIVNVYSNDVIEVKWDNDKEFDYEIFEIRLASSLFISGKSNKDII